MKDYAVPFVVALLVWGMLFLGIDYAIMALHGLSLIFHP